MEKKEISDKIRQGTEQFKVPDSLRPDEIEKKLEHAYLLAQSSNLWRQRMSIVCTWKTSQQGDASWCLRYAEKLLHHPHDLMHKAVGWMLREMGKRVSMELLRAFLQQHAHDMPRTTLRYAIEKMPDSERKEWMSVRQTKANETKQRTRT